ncbi:hypothetical protein [Parabacteroides sp. AF17-3]|uniref:hypothetical protein n=1 Tax=Parabacteroides sp. AF17-3 TaxID=2293113 RepID=UPI0013143CE9|nr:hypothetical protein [Parabacteroides sp. AF17-3]
MKEIVKPRFEEIKANINQAIMLLSHSDQIEVLDNLSSWCRKEADCLENELYNESDE